MPIYEYQCKNCDVRIERLQKLSNKPLTDCEDCSQSTLVKLVLASGFILKGTAWYATDFRNINKPAKDKAIGNPTSSNSVSGSSQNNLESFSTDKGISANDNLTASTNSKAASSYTSN